MRRLSLALVALLLASSSTVAQPGNLVNDPTGEIALWQTIEQNKRPDDYRVFLLMFPNSRFAPLARLRMGTQFSAVPPSAPTLYRMDASPAVAGMGQVVTLRCGGMMPPALFDLIVVVRPGTPDLDARGGVDQRQAYWSGLANLYDCAGAGIALPTMLAGSYEARYLSRQYNPDGRMEVVARTSFVFR